MTDTAVPVTGDGEAVRPPGGIEKCDLIRQAEVLARASAVCSIRQFRFWLRDLADGFEESLEVLAWAEEQGEVVAVELAGALMPGMLIATDIGFMKLAKVNRRDGDWSLLLKCSSHEQRQHNNGKNDYWMNLKAAGQSPVVVLA